MKVVRNGAGKNSLFSTCHRRADPLNHISNGEVAEWSNAAVLKTVERESVPRVRIPVSPPLCNKFSTFQLGEQSGVDWERYAGIG